VQGIPPHPSGHALAPEGVSDGKRHDLTCGHCCLRTSSWAEMCAHLNRAGMEQEDPYQSRSPQGEALLRLLPAPITVGVQSLQFLLLLFLSDYCAVHILSINC